MFRGLTSLSVVALWTAVGMGSAVAQDAIGGIHGELRLFVGACPRGWLHADGSLLSSREFPSTHSLFGQTFGGDPNAQQFAVPNLPNPAGLAWCVAVGWQPYPAFR